MSLIVISDRRTKRTFYSKVLARKMEMLGICQNEGILVLSRAFLRFGEVEFYLI